MEYLIYVTTLACIYVILASSLNLVVGYSGIFSFAHAAFYGIGAYTAAILTTKLGLNFLPAIVAGIAITAAIGAAVGIPALRTGGDYFILACLAFQLVTTRVFNNWVDVTGGPYGIFGIPRPRILDLSLSSGILYLPLALVCALLVVFACRRLIMSPYGLTLQAIREDEMVAQVLGRDVTLAKIIIFAISGGMAAIAGGLYAYYLGVVDPGSFGIPEIILMWAMIFVGGTGSLKGPVLGAVLLIFLPQALRLLGLQGAKAGEAQQMVYGLALVLLVLFRPHGLAGKYRVE